MSRYRTERRLRGILRQLARLREELYVVEEQLVPVTDEAAEYRLRALVSETPVAERQYRRAQCHAERLRRHRTKVLERISRLETDQDAILDKMAGT